MSMYKEMFASQLKSIREAAQVTDDDLYCFLSVVLSDCEESLRIEGTAHRVYYPDVLLKNGKVITLYKRDIRERLVALAARHDMTLKITIDDDRCFMIDVCMIECSQPHKCPTLQYISASSLMDISHPIPRSREFSKILRECWRECCREGWRE